MILNIENFRKLVTKGTMNFGIETLQLRFENGRITSNMLSSTGTSISILNVGNDVLDTDEDIVFNFSQPATDVIPFINLIDNDTVELIFNNLFMNLINGNNITKIAFCSENAVKRLGADDVRDVEWFYSMSIDENFINQFEKIKKIGSRFGKVYFVVKDKALFIETSDRSNIYSNVQRTNLSTIDMPDLTLAYKYSDMVNFFKCIEMDIEKNFTLKISYNNEQELGCIYTFSENGDEKYSLISRDNL